MSTTACVAWESFDNPDQWQELDRALLGCRGQRGDLDFAELSFIAATVRLHTHLKHGMSTVAEYIEWRLKYGSRAARERIRVAVALDKLPAIRSALQSGALPYTAVRELCRVASPTMETIWLERAVSGSVRDVEQLVASHKYGDHPDDPVEMTPRERPFAMKVTSSTLVVFREVWLQLEEELGHPLTEEEVVLHLCLSARRPPPSRVEDDVAPASTAEAPFQIALALCPSCDSATVSDGIEVHAAETALLQMACCDAEVITARDGVAVSARTLPPTMVQLVRHRFEQRCAVPGCRHRRFLDVHLIERTAPGAAAELENLVLLCRLHHRARHDGRICIRGPASALVVTHSDGRAFGTLPPWAPAAMLAAPTPPDAAAAGAADAAAAENDNQPRTRKKRATHVGQPASVIPATVTASSGRSRGARRAARG